MRQINKTTLLSTQYKKWEESMAENHVAYNSSDNKFYYDVVMNLFYCQRGVCAYTEVLLCVDKYFDLNCWQHGKYIVEKPVFFGALDHFDPLLKNNKGWLWDNVLMVQKDINDKHKRNQAVDDILKPDNPAYNPFELLEYDELLHVFIANTTNLDEKTQKKVNNMIQVLGINHDTIKKKRERYLGNIYNHVKIFRIATWEDESEKLYQFFTAFEMFKLKSETLLK